MSADWTPAWAIIGTILVATFAGLFYTNGRFADLHKRIDSLETGLTKRMDTLDHRLDDLGKRLDTLEADVREIRSLLIEALRGTRAGT
jgi:hypothetical protein